MPRNRKVSLLSVNYSFGHTNGGNENLICTVNSQEIYYIILMVMIKRPQNFHYLMILNFQMVFHVNEFCKENEIIGV